MKLHGFNNLTKSLSFNIYDLCHARGAEQQRAYIEYIDELYNARRLAEILCEVTDIIGAQVLNIAHQDYEPQGASVTMLIAEEPMASAPNRESVVGHLDKSHVTVHTYPESHPSEGLCTFRADVEVSTCGEISPLRALDHLIQSFESDIVSMDYRVRGFTRDVRGHKHFMDHAMTSIQHFIAEDIRARYRAEDVNSAAERLFHTRMHLQSLDLRACLMGAEIGELSHAEAGALHEQLHREMLEIFHGGNAGEGASN